MATVSLLVKLALDTEPDTAEAVQQAAAAALGISAGSVAAHALTDGKRYAVEVSDRPAGVHCRLDYASMCEQSSALTAMEARSEKLADAVRTLDERVVELEQQLRDEGKGDAQKAGGVGSALQRLRAVERRNRLLEAECADYRERLRKSDDFQQDILGTISHLKGQLARLTDELVLSNNWDPDVPPP
eukprot:TRINITY_DN8516_c1_g2_i1.p1 TRINITY_DN8516_c1_g2~~TRINITY_DN8516_c1_g2_i1.p1  ORF type:complete len:187 (+),score=43.36 TRINITY_DN8516_c1_g2_i1:101-661(+)